VVAGPRKQVVDPQLAAAPAVAAELRGETGVPAHAGPQPRPGVGGGADGRVEVRPRAPETLLQRAVGPPQQRAVEAELRAGGRGRRAGALGLLAGAPVVLDGRTHLAHGEEDVREAARAFTGWRTRDGRARFSPRYHDAGKKRVLGVSGELAGDDVVRIATGHPACARFLARKLLAEFVTPVPAERVVDELADRLAAGGELADVLEVLLASELAHDPRRAAFVYGPAAASPRVRSPVEWVVGTARALETRSPAGALERAAASLGQRLFEPPSVEGWEGHRAWLDSTSVWARIGLGISIAGAAGPDSNAVGDRDREAGIAMRAADLVATHELRCVDDVVRYGELVTLAGSAPSALQEQMRTAATGRSARLDEALRAVVRLGLASPESAVA